MTHSPQQIRFCASRDGARIAYATCGAGPPLVRVPHPMSHLKFDWDSPVWHHWLSLFTQRHTLVRYDMRGCGLSDREGVDFSFEKLINDLEAVVDAAGVQRFALFGISGGGTTAVAYAARHPERVSHLVLHGAFCRGRLACSPTPKQTQETELHLKAIELAFESENPGMRQFYTSIRMPDGTVDQNRAFNDLMRLATNPRNYTNLLRSYFQADVHDLAPQVRCPTIVFHVREDGVIAFDEGRSLAARIPGARFVPLESRNHLIVEGESAWNQLIEELEAFLPYAPVGSVPLLDALTAREHEVLELVAQGLDNGTIGMRLKISERTVRNNVSIIFSKLGVHSRAQAIVRARDAGFGQLARRRAASASGEATPSTICKS
jgi:pimeloyl-ACP methyl ester carboxylesterase/DNA-binding CsgD family transcriptional regulator